jgi:hypothetical protein
LSKADDLGRRETTAFISKIFNGLGRLIVRAEYILTASIIKMPIITSARDDAPETIVISTGVLIIHVT